MEPVFRTLEVAAKLVARATGAQITYQGDERIPAAGGAVVAINQTNDVDFLSAAPAALGGRVPAPAEVQSFYKAELAQRSRRRTDRA